MTYVTITCGRFYAVTTSDTRIKRSTFGGDALRLCAGIRGNVL